MKEFAFNQKHMGVEVVISIITDTHEQAEKIMEEAYAEIESYEKRFSRFLPESELSQLNRSQDMVVSETFFTVLEKSHELYQKTNGAFNPLFQITRYGYDRDFDALNGEGRLEENTEDYNLDFDSISMDSVTRRVVLAEGQQLDFGGILKGYLADQLSCNIFKKFDHCTGNIVNIGGDLHTAGLDAGGDPFEFAIFNPVTKESTSVVLTDQSLATSGTYKRKWQTADGIRHHILGADESDICSVSIIHRDGAIADAYAKLFLTKGVTAALEMVGDDDLKYLVVHQDGQVETNLPS